MILVQGRRSHEYVSDLEFDPIQFEYWHVLMFDEVRWTVLFVVDRWLNGWGQIRKRASSRANWRRINFYFTRKNFTSRFDVLHIGIVVGKIWDFNMIKNIISKTILKLLTSLKLSTVNININILNGSIDKILPDDFTSRRARVHTRNITNLTDT